MALFKIATTQKGVGLFGKIKTDTSSSAGLMEYSKSIGITPKTPPQGEKPKEFLSGGFISDVFDVLNTFQYGMVGLLKGKSFSEGIRTKQSWTDKDALGDYGMPGMIAGTLLDIGCDPLTYISPIALLKAVPGGKKALDVAGTGLDVAKTTFFKTRLGKSLGNMFIWKFGKDPIYVEMAERLSTKNLISQRSIIKMVEGVLDIEPEKAAKLLTKDETGRFIRTSLDKLKGVLSDDELFNVAKTYSILDDLGKEAVSLGRLGEVTWESNKGEYLKSIYEKHLKKQTGAWGYLKKSVKKIFKRKDITPEKMAELGQIDNPAYILYKSMLDLAYQNENVKFFNTVSKQFGIDEAVEGFEIVGKTKEKFGALAGKYIPKNIYDDLTEIMKVQEKGFAEKIVGTFKYNKVILNPATHARNRMSNRMLNWWKLDIGPWRQDLYFEASKQVRKGGKWMDEVKMMGGEINTFASREIDNILLSPEAQKGITGNVKKLAKILGDGYQGGELTDKMAAYIAKRQGGMNMVDAWKAAESALFNYSQVTPFVRKLRNSLWGYPFITFSAKAAPIVAETIIKHPGRISFIGKVKNAIENQTNIKELTAERASEPAWIRDGFYIKLPMKDKYGRSSYFDLTYIIPFGDLVTGKLFERQIKRETGQLESVPEAMIRNLPFINIVRELSRNQDFYGNKIWLDSDETPKQLGDLFRHLTKFMLPPLVADQIPGGYRYDKEAGKYARRPGMIQRATTKEKGVDFGGAQDRTLMQEILRNAGMKITPIDLEIQEYWSEYNKVKAMQTLLTEAGVMKEYSNFYIPKD